MTDHPTYQSFDDLLADIGKQAMESIRLNANAYTVNTLTGARGAFGERIMVLLRDVGYSEILRLMADDRKTASLRLPRFNVEKMEDAVFYSVATHVQALHNAVIDDHCFRWAEGGFLTTMERCAETAEKVVFVRRSRDMRKGAESIRRLLARFEYEGNIPDDFDVGSFAFQMEDLFRPAMNDQALDWLSLSGAGVDRPLLFELAERTKNYYGLSMTDPNRFKKLVSDEIVARWPQESTSVPMEESHDR